MKWTKCGELEFVSEDGDAYVFYSQSDPESVWVLDLPGHDDEYCYTSSTSAQHAYERYLRTGRVDGEEE